MSNIDRRWIYLIIGAVTVIFLLVPAAIPAGKSAQTTGMFNALESLKPGDTVILAVDYDPPASPEIYECHVGVVYHLLRKRCKIIATSLWPAGPAMTNKAFEDAIKMLKRRKDNLDIDPKYGVDYCNLGYKPGREVALVSMGASIKKTFPKDIKEFSTSDYDNLPIMKGIQNFDQISMIVNFSAGNPGTREWIAIVQSRFKVRLVAGVTAVMAPDLYAFFPRQIEGFAGGLAGSFEYRFLLYEKYYKGKEEAAVAPFPGPSFNQSMVVQSIIHFLIIFLVLVGNVMYFMEKRRDN